MILSRFFLSNHEQIQAFHTPQLTYNLVYYCFASIFLICEKKQKQDDFWEKKGSHTEKRQFFGTSFLRILWCSLPDTLWWDQASLFGLSPASQDLHLSCIGSAQSLLLNLQSHLIKRLLHTCLYKTREKYIFHSRLLDLKTWYCKIPIVSHILDTLIVIASYSS